MSRDLPHVDRGTNIGARGQKNQGKESEKEKERTVSGIEFAEDLHFDLV